MIRRAYIIGMVALGLTATMVRSSQAYGRFVSSAHNVQHYFQDLKKVEGSMNSFERFVFSLVLANSSEQAPTRHQS